MKKKNWTQDEIIEAIKSGRKPNRNLAFIHIFFELGWKEDFIKKVQQKGGSLHDAQDAFQNGVIAFEKSLRKGDFKGKGELKAYFMTIAKNRWIDSTRKKKELFLMETDYVEPMGEDIEDMYIEAEKQKYIKQALSLLEERCEQMLTLYKYGYSLKELMKEFSFNTVQATNNALHRCRKRFHQFFVDNPAWKKLID